MATKNAHTLPEDDVQLKQETAASPDGPAPDPKADTTGNPYAKYGFSGDVVLVTLHESPDDLGRAPVFLGLGSVDNQAYEALLPRNVKSTIPREVFESCIRDASVMRYEEINGNMTAREVPRFAYTFHGQA